jgi:hypothetical protein
MQALRWVTAPAGHQLSMSAENIEQQLKKSLTGTGEMMGLGFI